MKKLFGILGLALLLSACESKPTVTTSEYYDRSEPRKAVHFTYNGHDYIMFNWGIDSYDRGIGYVHDPDCKKCKEKIRED